MKNLIMLTLVSILFTSTAFASETLGLPKGECTKAQASQARVEGKNYTDKEADSTETVKEEKIKIIRE